MNQHLKSNLERINASFNNVCDSLKIKFNKDIVEVSLVQFLLNVSIARHSNVWIPDEDIKRIEEYINFKILFRKKHETLNQLKENHVATPFIFDFMNYMYEIDSEGYDIDNYYAVLSLFANIALDVNDNFIDKGKVTVNTREIDSYNLYIELIKRHITDLTPKQINIDSAIANINIFCQFVNDIIDEKYDGECENDGINENDETNGDDKINEDNENNKQKESVESIIEELNTYIGLNKVKEEVSQLVDLIQMRKKREESGLKNPQMTYHLCFMGNPGTGKTTVARIIARLYKALGVVKKGHLIEVSRQDLVAEYVGQTSTKTKKVIKKAYNGILFIDEAYSLTNKDGSNDYGKEAIEVLLKEMEDHRDKLVVIAAGYDNLMTEFLSTNPGLESRFNTFIHFEDYSPSELVKIIEMISLKNDYVIDEKCKQYLENEFRLINGKKDKNFANARFVRNLFENAIKNQASRIAKFNVDVEIEKLKELTIEDFENEI